MLMIRTMEAGEKRANLT